MSILPRYDVGCWNPSRLVSVLFIKIVCVLLPLLAKMHLMYYLNNEGKRIYTLKVI